VEPNARPWFHQVLAYHEKKYSVFRRMTDDQREYRRIMAGQQR